MNGMITVNSPRMLIRFFDVSSKEFDEFWDGLTPEEKDYYLNLDLEKVGGTRYQTRRANSDGELMEFFGMGFDEFYDNWDTLNHEERLIFRRSKLN